MPSTPPPAVTPTPEQQKVLDRIAAQRARLRSRHAAVQKAVASEVAQRRVEPSAPFVVRLLAFARLHPVAVAVVIGAAVVAGPRRVMRWATIVAPLAARMKRG